MTADEALEIIDCLLHKQNFYIYLDLICFLLANIKTTRCDYRCNGKRLVSNLGDLNNAIALLW